MKLSELRPCDNCGGKLTNGMFYIVRTSIAIVDRTAARETIGLMNFFDGHLDLAEAMTPNAEAVKIGGDEHGQLWTESMICQNCFLSNKLNLAVLQERASERATQGESKPCNPT